MALVLLSGDEPPAPDPGTTPLVCDRLIEANLGRWNLAIQVSPRDSGVNKQTDKQIKAIWD